jgi:hypothetical protein
MRDETSFALHMASSDGASMLSFVIRATWLSLQPNKHIAARRQAPLQFWRISRLPRRAGLRHFCYFFCFIVSTAIYSSTATRFGFFLCHLNEMYNTKREDGRL